MTQPVFGQPLVEPFTIPDTDKPWTDWYVPPADRGIQLAGYTFLRPLPHGEDALWCPYWRDATAHVVILPRKLGGVMDVQVGGVTLNTAPIVMLIDAFKLAVDHIHRDETLPDLSDTEESE